MTDDIYDAVVVGGGIIAASAGQHLAAAGFRTLLAERGDYGSGTSSRTSRLQHCGLTYFTPAGNSLAAFVMRPRFAWSCFELCRRAMRGRAEFVSSSPERTRPVEFIVPLTAENAIPAWKARIAFALMEHFDGGRVSLGLEILDAAEARAHPALAGLAGLDTCRGAIRFLEHQYLWPERIVIDTIVKGREIGLTALNYTPVVAIERQGDLWRVGLGGEHPRSVRTRAVVDCAGVWVDEVIGLTGARDLRLNTGAKGTNVAVRLPERFRGLGFETLTSTGAPFYLIPWGDHHYIGPWDTPADGAPENLRAHEDEIAAILREMARLFPQIAIARDDVLYSWAGVRPRTAAGDAPLGSMGAREHDLTDRGLPNVFAFTGGLLMTHRDAGRRLTRAVARRIAPSGPRRPVDGTARPVPDGDRVTETSITWAIEKEQGRTLTGLLRRRLPVGWEEDLGLSQVEEAARLAAGPLGWSEAQTRAAIDHFRRTTVSNFAPRTVPDRGGPARDPR